MNLRFTVTVLLSAVTAMAASPIAMRVDVEPVRAAGDNTTMAVTVQVAPEDRSRVGTDAWIQGELRQRGARVVRLARAVDLDENGRARIEVDWPPGEYELQVEIEGERRRGTGVWIQRVTVPDMRNAEMEGTPEPVPVSEAAATVAATTPATAEPKPRDPESAAPPEPEPAATPTLEPRTAAIAAAAATTAAASAASEPRTLSDETGKPQPKTPPERESAPPPTPAPTTEAIPVAAATTAAASAASGPRSPSPETRDPQPTPLPDAEPAADPTPTPSTETIAVAATTAAASAPSEARSSSPETRDPAAPIPAKPDGPRKWPIAPGSTDLTVMVTERNRPVIGLGATAFGLKIAGKDTAIQRIGEGKAVPLNLGLAVGVSQASNEVLDNVVRRLEKLALHTTGGDGEISFATAGVGGSMVVPWGATPEDISTTFASVFTQNQVNLSAILSDSITTFAGRRGRSFLIVVTDGIDTSTKADWKEATSVATNAGIPIFVVGLSDTGFPSRTRSSLVKLANASGGRSYFLADAGMLDLTLDYVGELIDSSYVLQFAAPPAGGAVKVDSGNRAWEVHHPSRIP